MPRQPTDVLDITIWEDSGCSVLARIKNNTGDYITQASLTSISAKVYDSDGALVATLTPSISSSVFDTLQTSSDDSRWTKDSTGFNFRYTLAASNFASGDTTYRVEFIFTPTSGDVFYLICSVRTLSILSS